MHKLFWSCASSFFCWKTSSTNYAIWILGVVLYSFFQCQSLPGRAKPGRHRRRRLFSPYVLEGGSGASPPSRRCTSGSPGPARPGDAATVPSFDGEARLQEALAAARPWSGRHGPRWARVGPDGFERAGICCGMGMLEVEAATWRGPGTAALRLAYCSTAAGASRAYLGPTGPDGAWCAPAAMSGQWPPLGGGGGFLLRGCEAAVPYPDGVVYLRCLGLPVSRSDWWWWLQDRGGTCWWVAMLGGRAPLCQSLLWDGGGRNPCQFVWPWRGVAFGWHHSFLEGVVGIPYILYSTYWGETLGTVWSGQQRRFEGVFLVEGAAWDGALRNAWSMVEKTVGAAVAGHHCVIASPLLSFLFSWTYLCCCPSLLLDSNWLYLKTLNSMQ
jgi:hypothetical protein